MGGAEGSGRAGPLQAIGSEESVGGGERFVRQIVEALREEMQEQQQEQHDRLQIALEKHYRNIVDLLRDVLARGAEIGVESARPDMVDAAALEELQEPRSPTGTISSKWQRHPVSPVSNARSSVLSNKTENSSVCSRPELRRLSCTDVEEMMLEEQRNLQEVVRSQQHQILCDNEHPTGFNFCAVKVVSSPLFEYTIIVLIVANAVLIGAHADWAMKHMSQHVPDPIRIFDFSFTIAFLVEILLRIFADGHKFLRWTNKNLGWNVVDTVLALLGLLEELLQAFLISAPNVSVLRLIRMMRLIRLIRVIRVMHFFSDLRVMVNGIRAAARSVMWLAFLLMVMIYIFAVCLLQVAAQWLLESNAGSRFVLQSESQELLIFHFGSLFQAMYTLYQCINNGLEWGAVAEPLFDISVWVVALFVIYITFAVFCVLNVVTGVFVENAHNIANIDANAMFIDHMEQRQQRVAELKEIFKQGDKDGDGTIKLPEFQVLFSNPHVQATFHKLGLELDSYNAYGLFHVFDFDSDGEIKLDELVHGFLQLHGSARSLDIYELKCEVQAMRKALRGALTQAVTPMCSMPADAHDLLPA